MHQLIASGEEEGKFCKKVFRLSERQVGNMLAKQGRADGRFL